MSTRIKILSHAESSTVFCGKLILLFLLQPLSLLQHIRGVLFHTVGLCFSFLYSLATVMELLTSHRHHRLGASV